MIAIDRKLTVGSLFAGIGGIDLGLEWTGGFRTEWFCEFDPDSKEEHKDQFNIKVLKERFPRVSIYGDITKLDCSQLPYVDVLTGGFPCQDISCAGRRAGIKEGTRSGLWFHYARIIGEVRPRYIIIENVPGLIGNGLDIVLADIERLGYKTLQPVLLEAATVGAPHKRERIFIVAYCDSPSTKHEIQARRNMLTGKSEDVAYSDSTRSTSSRGDKRVGRKRKSVKKDVANTSSKGLEIGFEQENGCGTVWQERETTSPGNWWQVEPGVGRVATRIPDRMDRLKALGNAVVPQCAQVIGYAILEMENKLKDNKEG